MVAVALIGLIFVILSIASVLQTCRIDPAKPASEKILFDNDPIAVNLSLIVITLLALIGMKRLNISLSKVDTRFMIFILLIVTTIVSLAWINLVQSVATGDARHLLDTAKGAAQDDYTKITTGFYTGLSYYLFYPSHLGYVFYAELMYRIFGTGCSDVILQLPNAIALDFVYVGVVMITSRIFKRTGVTNATALMLIFCLQPMLMTTFTSGLFIGLAFAVWSVYFTVRYITDNKLLHAGFAALLIMLAVMIRSGYAIILFAIVIALILHAVGSRRFLALAAAAVMILCAFGGQRLLIFSYAERSGMKLDSEVTPTLNAYLGIGESTMAPGWFNWNAMTTLRDTANAENDYQPDTEAAEKVAREGINARVSALNKEHRLLNFYKQKLLSQFNEPSFESVWISQTRSHDLPEGEELSSIVTGTYTGGIAMLLDRWFPYYHMIVYFGFAAGMAWMLIRRKLAPEAILLPVAVLGAVLYHMICEAKSQYLLPYFILLIPFAVYGMAETAAALRGKTEFLFKKQEESE